MVTVYALGKHNNDTSYIVLDLESLTYRWFSDLSDIDISALWFADSDIIPKWVHNNDPIVTCLSDDM